jgi:hypothetical protein
MVLYRLCILIGMISLSTVDTHRSRLLRSERQLHLPYMQASLTIPWPRKADFLLPCSRINLFPWDRHSPFSSREHHNDHLAYSPGSATKKSSDLNGCPDPEPCLGGPPTFRNPEKLDPTFQIVTLRSASDAVTNRLPSGENDNAETG